MNSNIITSINSYYTAKVLEHGTTPRGVDWNSEESQQMRFQQLCKVIGSDEEFSVLDYGCGYGAMLPYLESSFGRVNYTGFDISEEMIARATESNGVRENALWTTSIKENEAFDYVIASGIFNVRLNNTDADWLEHIKETLNRINACSTKGFSFNLLTSYSDKEYMKEYLYYADPAAIFGYCKTNFSKYVALLHDYPLYEFTILVRKF